MLTTARPSQPRKPISDIVREREHNRKLYRVDEKHGTHFAKQYLVSRRRVESGVRFVQVYFGGSENQRCWDGQNAILANHGGLALETDQPIAALPTDSKQRDSVDEMVVIWRGEFGRLPVAQKTAKPGRDFRLTVVEGKVITPIVA